MAALQRFIDEQKLLRHFSDEIWVVCKHCGYKAIITFNHDNATQRIVCAGCGYNREATSDLITTGYGGKCFHGTFGCELWLSAPFKNETFWAYNSRHLDYLEQYIASGIRENPERTGFTMVEKLPRFMQVRQNRESLLKLIEKLKSK